MPVSLVAIFSMGRGLLAVAAVFPVVADAIELKGYKSSLCLCGQTNSFTKYGMLACLDRVSKCTFISL